MKTKRALFLSVFIFLIINSINVLAQSGNDTNLGFDTFDNCGVGDPIYYNAYNQSDSTTLQNAQTGQALVEDNGDAEILDEKLILNNEDIVYFNQDLDVTAVNNFTVDIIFERETHGAFINNWYGLHQGTNGGTPDAARFGTVGDGGGVSNWDLFLSGNEGDLAPAVSAENIHNTLWLFRTYVSGENDIINATLYNITGTAGSFVLVQIASKKVTGYSNIDTVQSITTRQTTASTVTVNISEMAVYEGQDCRISGTPSPPGPSEFLITVTDSDNNSAVNNFTVVLLNSTSTLINFSTTGEINFNNISNGIYVITISAL